MACEVCEHCADPVTTNDKTIHEGYSYHRRCHKCYVCSETNLHEAEVFKGTIFCSRCSNRIFNTFSPCRKPNHNKPSKHKKNKRKNLYELTSETNKMNREQNVIKMEAMEAMAASISHDTASDSIKKNTKRKASPHAVELMCQRRKRKFKEKSALRKPIADFKMSTEDTSKSLKRAHRPISSLYDQMLASSPIPRIHTKWSKLKKSLSAKKNNYFSDMRIAELGASIEIANIGLRKKSEEIPVIIKSVPQLKKTTSSLSVHNSSMSGDSKPIWTETTVSTSSPSQNVHWMDRRIRSIVKLPYKCFKRNILRQSSLVSTLMSVDEEKETILKKINSLFHEEITEHQRRGLKRLYSTINRQNTPQKLGWLRVTEKTSEILNCKHIATSHSYRCMRANVMRMAGPTKSQLAVFRSKMKKIMIPTFVMNVPTKKKTKDIQELHKQNYIFM